MTHPKVGPRQLLRVETEIYGLVSGPSSLRASLTVGLLAAGYVKNPYDKCLFTLFSSDETSEGQLDKTMEGFYDKYRCGKAVDFTSAGQEGTRFAGRRVVENPEFLIIVLMDEYVKSKLRPIEVPKGEISDGMLHEHQGSQWWFGMAGIYSKTRHGGASPDHSIWV